MSSHAPLLQPSSGHRWLECTASPQMQIDNPCTDESPEAEIGTTAHLVASEVIELYHKYRKIDYNAVSKSLRDYIGTVDENGVLIDQGMIDAVSVYVNYVLNLPKTNGIEPLSMVEYKVEIPDVDEECFGTVDYCSFCTNDKVLRVVDYKHGHSFVDVVNNIQLILYTSGLLTWLKSSGYIDDDVKVIMTIVQPRCYVSEPIRTWEVMASDLRGTINSLRHAAIIVYSGYSTTKAGTHCKNCSALTVCDAAHKHLSGIVEVIGGIDVSKISPNDLNGYLSFIKSSMGLLKDMHLSLSSQAVHLIESGVIVKGLSVQPKYGRRKWDIDDDKVIQLGEITGVDLIKGYDLMTPTQAIKAGVSDNVVDKCSVMPLDGVELIESDSSDFQKQLKEMNNEQ